MTAWKINVFTPVILAAIVFTMLQTGKPVRAADGACDSSAAYHALDFSLGTWSIAVPGAPSGATSVIQREVGGCAIVENWKGGRQVGINVDAYNSEDKHWYRFFVDSIGKVHVFEGVAAGASIVYRGTSPGPNGTTELNRLELRSEGPKRMTQLWQKSVDGKTWTIAFQGTYTRTSR